jgi:hypothetical protein
MWAAKKLLSSFLSSALNEYVEAESIDSENLNVDVMKGELHLENLRLRSTALEALGLPLQLERGLIGQVKITGANLSTVRCIVWMRTLARSRLASPFFCLPPSPRTHSHNTPLSSPFPARVRANQSRSARRADPARPRERRDE